MHALAHRCLCDRLGGVKSAMFLSPRVTSGCLGSVSTACVVGMLFTGSTNAVILNYDFTTSQRIIRGMQTSCFISIHVMEIMLEIKGEHELISNF